MIYSSYDHNMPTFEVFLSFSFWFIFYVRKNYTSIVIYEKSFSLYTYIPIHDKLFLYTRALKTLSLYINMVYKNPIPVQKFLFCFSIYTRGFTQKFLYIHSFLTHIIYTHTKSFHTLFTYEKLFSFLYRYDICSQSLFLCPFMIKFILFYFILFIKERMQ